MQILQDLGYYPTLRSVTPRVCPNRLEASETWIVDLRDRMRIPADDREPALAVDAEVTREQERAAKAELASMRAAIYGKDSK
jgi:hypothetical protein